MTEAQGRLARQLGPGATAKSVAGITSQPARYGGGSVVLATRDPLPALPLWLANSILKLTTAAQWAPSIPTQPQTPATNGITRVPQQSTNVPIQNTDGTTGMQAPGPDVQLPAPGGWRSWLRPVGGGLIVVALLFAARKYLPKLSLFKGLFKGKRAKKGGK